jgi:two-component system, LytTR family, response regulator
MEMPMAIRTVIVDDEPLVRASVRHLLKSHADIEVVGEAADGHTAIEIITSALPDLLFLDIRIPGLNGFDVLERISSHHVPVVVFVTAYDEYALRAFEVHALDYLLKPFTKARFEGVLEYARRQLRIVGELHGQEELIMALDARKNGSLEQDYHAAGQAQPVRRIAVSDNRGRVVLIDVEQVDWIEASQNYSTLHVGSHAYLLRSTLGALGQRLNPETFVRIHRSTIVNIRRAQQIVPKGHSDYELVLKDGSVLKVSRNYRTQLFTGVPGRLGRGH